MIDERFDKSVKAPRQFITGVWLMDVTLHSRIG